MEMRLFTDSAGTEWTVFEVKRQTLGQANYLPKGYGSGWLCFESTREKRRLTPVPENWRELENEELIDLLRRAKRVAKRQFDTSDGVGSWGAGDIPDVNP
jgi:hypothetical protein